ncbi:MAG TPA: putative oxidoreductase C-terminal domain-containing protein, partial [Vicinamibacteria bacterium]|nr:putative oxidoreductase C-terminal domain-containing protein [Vicinamibacteria bacterium]
EQRWRPELYVVPHGPADAAAVETALRRRVGELAKSRPGLAVEAEGARLRVGIPDRYRVGHEPHFAQVTERFLGYLKDPASLPKWERANMLAKYWVTTQAVEMSR